MGPVRCHIKDAVCPMKIGVFIFFFKKKICSSIYQKKKKNTFFKTTPYSTPRKIESENETISLRAHIQRHQRNHKNVLKLVICINKDLCDCYNSYIKFCQVVRLFSTVCFRESNESLNPG